MSWTSEFELPPQGPQVLPAEAGTTAETGELDEPPQTEDSTETAVDDYGDGEADSPETTPEETLDGPGFELSDIPEEGPLDPSVFDGLFADLTEPLPEPDDYVQPREFESEQDEELDQVALDEIGVDDAAADEDEVDVSAEDEIDVSGEDEVEIDDQAEFETFDLDDADEPVGDIKNELVEDDLAESLDEYSADQDGARTEDHGEDEELIEREPVDQDIAPDDFEDQELVPDEDIAEDEYTEDDFDDQELEDEYTEDDFDDQELEDEYIEDEYNDQQHTDEEPGNNGNINGQEPAGPVHQLFEPVPPISDPVVQVQVLEQPLPAVATSPPIAFDEHHTETNGFEAAPYYEMPAAEVVDQLNPTVLTAEKPRRWPAFVTAILIGGTLGIGGAVALTTLQQSDDDDQAASVTAPIAANEVDQEDISTGQQTGNQANPSQDGAPTGQQATTSLLVDGELALSSVRFIPGTTELSVTSQETLQRFAEAIEGTAPEPTTITVRTFSEPTAQANLDLSVQQAAAVNEYLASLGVQFGGVSARGIGAAPLQNSLPVPNFVVVNPNLQAAGLKQAMSNVGPFEIGIDPDSLQLRPESINALATIGAALTENTGSISLAGYSYDRPNRDANKAMATAAVDAAIRYLVDNHQVDPARLSSLTPGSFPYVLGPGNGGHVDIKRGRSAAVEVAVHSLDHSVLAFAAGSDALSGAAAEELTRIASLISDAEAVAVISVRSSGESSPEANDRLSEQQAAAIGSFLSDAGLGDEQFRIYGIGDVAKLRTDAAISEVNITILS